MLGSSDHLLKAFIIPKSLELSITSNLFTWFESIESCNNVGYHNFFQIPTINQENGIAGSEPTETLKIFRSDKQLRANEKQQGKVRPSPKGNTPYDPCHRCAKQHAE